MRMRALALVVMIAAFTGFLFAQATATSRLSGSVIDPTGLAVPTATVDVFMPGGVKPILSATVTSEGLFTFSSVAAGTYDLSVTAAGFRKHTARGVNLTAGAETALPPIKLEVGSTTEVVEVKESALTVQTTNAELSSSVSRAQIKDLPVLNRSPLGFVGTQAGAVLGNGGDTVINGQRTSFTNMTLDGINIQDNYIRTNAVDFSPNLLLLDQVAEMTVSTQNTNPAAGTGSSQVSLVTPSGTDQFHGNLFISNRNNKFAANTWFNNQAGVGKPFLNQNQLGGSLGGPIVKDKLFFYFNYEAYRQHAQSAQTRTILTADGAKGIFTYLSGGVAQKVNLLQVSGLTIDPTVAALIAKIPTPDKINNYNVGDSSTSLLRNTAGFLFNQRNNRIRNNVTARGDYVMSAKSTIHGTYAWNSDLLDRPDVNPSAGYQLIPDGSNNDKVNFMSTSWRYSPTTTLTNELLFGFNRAPALFLTSEDFSNSIIGGTIFNTPVATFRAQGRFTNTYNIANNASWVHGAHNVQFGLQWERNLTAPYNDAGITPTFTTGLSASNPNGISGAQLPGASSSDVTAANSLFTTLVGYLTSDTQTYNVKSRTSGYVNGQTNARNWQMDDYSFYVQDNWKAARRLTLNLGMRWEYYSPVKEQNGLVLLPTMVNNNVVATLLNNSTLDFASGSGRPLYNPDKNNFGPNVGLAWDPTGEGKMAIRAGYSINFVNDEYLVALTGNAGTNAGLAQTVTAQNLTSLIRNGLPAVTTPAFTVPRTFLDNYNLSTTTNFGMADPNLRSPYVQQWNIGIQRELKDFILEARYVGNHGTKLLRAIDLNQININAQGFLGDFLRAQNNGFLAQKATGTFVAAYNPNISGSQPLTVFPLMPSGGSLTTSANVTSLQQGTAADMAFTYMSNKTNGPINFMPFPYAASLRLMTNYSNSTYNGLQIEGRTRERRGLTLQANYTYSKVLSDASSGSDNNNQARVEPLMDNNNPQLERARANFDLTHVIRFNYVYRVPIGSGHIFSAGKLNRWVLNGWQISGIFQHQSGQPYSVFSGRGTFNRNGVLGTNDGNTVNTNMTMDQLRQVMSFRMTGSGPYMVAASALGADGRAVAADGSAPFSGEAFLMPGAGTIGQLGKRVFDGPWTTTFDFGALKQFHITERKSIDLRLDSSNFFNHPAFSLGNQTVTSTTFGKITGTFSGRRVFQGAIYFRF
jgi:hypothetical protein